MVQLTAFYFYKNLKLISYPLRVNNRYVLNAVYYMVSKLPVYKHFRPSAPPLPPFHFRSPATIQHSREQRTSSHTRRRPLGQRFRILHRFHYTKNSIAVLQKRCNIKFWKKSSKTVSLL